MEFIERASPFGMGNPRPNLLLGPSTVRMNKRFARITDGANRTWYGTFQGTPPVADNERVNIVASPVIREDLGEKFIHLAIKEFVVPEN
jgi:hypothetical protein